MEGRKTHVKIKHREKTKAWNYYDSCVLISLRFRVWFLLHGMLLKLMNEYIYSQHTQLLY